MLELSERVRLVRHDRELGLVLRVLLVVLREHGLATVVAVARPVEHLETPALGSEQVERRACGRGPPREEARTDGSRSELEQGVSAQPRLQRILIVNHLDLLRSTPATCGP